MEKSEEGRWNLGAAWPAVQMPSVTAQSSYPLTATEEGISWLWEQDTVFIQGSQQQPNDKFRQKTYDGFHLFFSSAQID